MEGARKEDQSSFGQQLREYRVVTGLSQVGLAEHLGIRPRRLSWLERGKLFPPREVFFYERLLQAPGMTEEQARGLIRTATAKLSEVDLKARELRIIVDPETALERSRGIEELKKLPPMVV